MKLYQIKPEEENMTTSVTPLHTSRARHKADIDRVLSNPSPLTSMTFLRTLTFTARTDTHVTGDTLMKTPGPRRSPTADIRDTFKEVLEQASSMICLRTWRECLHLMDTPNRLKTGFMVHQNSTVGQ